MPLAQRMTDTAGGTIAAGAGAAATGLGASSFQITVVTKKATPAEMTSSMQ